VLFPIHAELRFRKESFTKETRVFFFAKAFLIKLFLKVCCVAFFGKASNFSLEKGFRDIKTLP
jgi:hypothetical protein